MSHGDYTFFTRRWFTDKSFGRSILATDDTTALAGVLVPKSANHQLHIQRIVFAPTTYAAQSMTFQDNAGTAIKVGQFSIPASGPTTGGLAPNYILDFGPHGMALTAGKQLDIVMSAAGPAGHLHVEAYEKVVTALTNFNQSVNRDGNVVSGTTKTTPANA